MFVAWAVFIQSCSPSPQSDWLLMRFIFMCGFFFGRIMCSCSLTISLLWKTGGTSTLAGPHSCNQTKVGAAIYRAHRHADSSHWDSKKAPELSWWRNWESSAAYSQVHAWTSCRGKPQASHVLACVSKPVYTITVFQKSSYFISCPVSGPAD